MREYRHRRRNVVESELVQEPQHQVPYVEGSDDATPSNYSDFYRHRLAHEEFKINLKSLITKCHGVQINDIQRHCSTIDIVFESLYYSFRYAIS
ncbi:hypothetical protein TNIN_67361 [Trichonephila inaurata madagascariensis]|uniref:Uncharacterized protein n=1 Tax=Trichonephila inaurata madagascariensis TaxID=2747483 RepID=A0A8X7CT93_9ARAC|nr:hypothetical protein TNIN_67361 [Trichonephila inaurata madagascariensis]